MDLLVAQSLDVIFAVDSYFFAVSGQCRDSAVLTPGSADVGMFMCFVHDVLSVASQRLVDEKWFSFQLYLGSVDSLTHIVRSKLYDHTSWFACIFVLGILCDSRPPRQSMTSVDVATLHLDT